MGSVLSKSANPAIAKLGGALQGAAAGAKMGAAFGPWGAAIGAAAGAVIGFIGAAKRLQAELLAMREEFYKQFGGLDALKAKAKEAGVALDAVFNAKNKKALALAIDEAKQKLEAFDDLLQDFDGDIKKLEATAAQAGVSLQEIWDAKTVEEYLKAVKKVKGQLADWEDAIKALDAAMEKYGVTVDQLGPKFKQMKLDEMMVALQRDWEVLHAAGVSYAVLVEKMGPDINKAVDQYINAGVEIPKSMKPIIDELWKQGKLVHENGVAFTEAEYQGLKYGTTLTEAMMSAVDAILDLVAALTGIPRDVNTTVHVRTERTESEAPGAPAGVPEYASGSGWTNFGPGKLAVLHGIERVQTPGQAAQAATAGGISRTDLDKANDRLARKLHRAFRDAVLKAV
jgi:hypothetical protein